MDLDLKKETKKQIQELTKTIKMGQHGDQKKKKNFKGLCLCECTQLFKLK